MYTLSAVQLMLGKVKAHESGTLDDGHILLQLYEMARKMTVLAGGGALCGIVAGVITAVRFCLLIQSAADMDLHTVVITYMQFVQVRLQGCPQPFIT